MSSCLDQIESFYSITQKMIGDFEKNVLTISRNIKVEISLSLCLELPTSTITGWATPNAK